MKTTTFLLNGPAADQGRSTAWVTINEVEGGKLSFRVSQLGTIGNLRGIYFDVADEGILNSLRVDTESKKISISDNSNNNHENVTNIDGTPYKGNNNDLGLEVAETEAGKKDTNSYRFILSSTKRKLVLSDFSNIQLDQSGANGGAGVQDNDENSHRWLYMGLG